MVRKACSCRLSISTRRPACWRSALRRSGIDRTRRSPMAIRMITSFALSVWIAASPHGDPRQAPAPVAGTGIDVSRYSGAVDWSSVKAQGHVYGFVKATEGQTLEDPDFDTHWPKMKQAGILRGAYHFYVTRDDPAAQAKFFIKTVALEPGDLAPVLDVETLSAGAPPENLLQGIQTWLDLIEAQY